jgi:hypothetical protein
LVVGMPTPTTRVAVQASRFSQQIAKLRYR